MAARTMIEEPVTMTTMRRLSLVLPLALAAALGAGVGVVAPSAGAVSATDAPTVTVTPSTGVAGGDVVTVDATGLAPDVAVRLIQCDVYTGDPEQDCYPSTTVTADGAGTLSTSVTLADPVFRSEPFGDPTPVYCRADACRIFAVWSDASGEQVAASDPLVFTGSPATITATPSSELRRRQWVRVQGTAYGAEGHAVVIVEEACFSIVQGSGCYGTIVKGVGTIAADGTYALRVRATRYLADGTDCADALNILGQCELSAQILDATGQPDDTFGLSQRGQPAAWLTFRP
jgi:Neocarzinostatin family